MVRLNGTRTTIRLPDLRCRETATWVFECPDGVGRCVTIPNWKWTTWHWPPGSAMYPEEAADAWRFAQIFARRHPAAAVFADKLIRNVDSVYRRKEFRANNDNFYPMAFDPLARGPYAPPRWGRGGVSSVFKRCAGRP
jgi:hypothetical protein